MTQERTGAETRSTLNKAQLTYFQELLDSKRREALRERRDLSQRRRLEINVSENNHLSTDHVADHTADPSAAEKLISKHKKMLAKIDEALENIKNGTYGICEKCQRPISKKRLQATPIANLCCPCKEKKERQERQLKGGNGTKRPRLSPLYA
ncbi:TraR/DksA family transcriptional regulator [Patescibacteria group bacterium]|nr:TraR/DksA family transcriptional regulator [Patescibacteria group bacterium]MBU4142844.1 TraR/DksA family transcriptional regulator [Patescibacteria group bacterium]